MHDFFALKVTSLALGAVSVASAALTQVAPAMALPLEWSGLLALVGAALAYGELRGRIKAREEAQKKTDADVQTDLAFLEAVVTRLAEHQGVPIADLVAARRKAA